MGLRQATYECSAHGKASSGDLMYGCRHLEIHFGQAAASSRRAVEASLLSSVSLGGRLMVLGLSGGAELSGDDGRSRVACKRVRSSELLDVR